jgi:molybdopterin-containing oxidoreductase family iron-sulfur binding subunit
MKITRKELLRLGGAALLTGGAGAAVRALDAGAGTAPTATDAIRWGMVVDTRACAAQTECRECSRACNATHNVPQIPLESQQVKWISKEPQARVFPFQVAAAGEAAAASVPVLCNHCASPPCVPVCPTQATWKRADGIVMMDYHRCIGCRYCMAACPYGARSFNFVSPRPYLAQTSPDYPTRTQGVVEKCNFCAERLAVGRQPACVEACPVKALEFGNLNDASSSIRRALRARPAVQRRPELGTGPAVFYLL